MTNPDHFIRFEYNSTSKDKEITLETNYVDLKKTTYSGKIVLKPYESIVLIKDTKGVPNMSGSVNGFQTIFENCEVRITWASVIDEKFSHFELEKSTDQSNFKVISKITSGQNQGLQSFLYTDSQLEATNYYRLKMIDLDGNFTYSPVLEEQTDCKSDSWQIYPNLLNGGNAELTIKLFTQQPSVIFTIIDQFGRKIKTFQAETIPGWNTLQWNLPDLYAGMYYLHHSDILLNKALPFVVGRN
jgi:hypothetical protein